MKLIINTPAKSLNKAYLKQSIKRDQIEQFKVNLARLFDRVNEKESEENLKNIVSDFLKDTWYKVGYEINTKERADLVIHNGKSAADPVGVIAEVKRPTNRTEMISPDRPNAKALHELLHYYMRNATFVIIRRSSTLLSAIYTSGIFLIPQISSGFSSAIINS